MQEVINLNLLKEYDKELRTVSNIWAKEKSYNIDDTVQYRRKQAVQQVMTH